MNGNIYYGDELIASVYEEFGGYTVLTVDDGEKHFFLTKSDALRFIKELQGKVVAA